MQENNIKTMAIGVSLASVLLFGLLYFFMPRFYNWEETYKQESKENPYDFGVIYELLPSYFPNQTFHKIENSFVEELLDQETSSSYIYFGEKVFLTGKDSELLLSYITKGNSAFIAVEKFPKQLLEAIYYFNFEEEKSEELIGDTEESLEEVEEYTYDNVVEAEGEETEENWTEEVEELIAQANIQREIWSGVSTYQDSSAKFNYVHPELKRETAYVYEHMEKGKKETRFWNSFQEDEFQYLDIPFETLGTLDSVANFVRIPVGKGFLYLHASPYAFTNFHLLNEDKLEYAGKAFSHLPEGDIYWDKKSTKFTRLQDMKADGPTASSLAYILSQKSLRWAWYLLFGMAVLYILFRAKREQRVIPVLEGNPNSSLEFINTIGNLYFLKNDHRNLAKRKMQLFLSYVREHYKIPTNKIDQDMKKRLAAKSGVALDVVEDIFLRFHRLDRATEISEDHLVNFHKQLDLFFKTCR